MGPAKASSARAARTAYRRARSLRLLVALLCVVGVVVVGCNYVTGGGTVAPSAATSEVAISGSESIDPSMFSPGACMAFDPTAGNRHETVFIDAGHGGIDPGAVGTTQSGTTIDEATETLPVELEAMALLRAKGFRVVVSRTQNSTVLRLAPADESDGQLSLLGSHDDVAARDICANDAKAVVLIGIYFDASTSAHGAGSVTLYDSDRPFAAANLRLANLVQNDVMFAMDIEGWAIPDGGVQPDTGFGSHVGDPSASGIAGEAAGYNHVLLLGPAQAGYFSTPSEMPGVIIEPLYITDPFEGSIADSAQGQRVVAGGIVNAVEQFFEPETTSTDTSTSAP